jgi:prevent-host-death family protein
MTDTVNVYEAKTHLSKLLERVEHGEEIVIARAGRPIAKLVPVPRRTEPRKPGGWEGRVWMAPDFDELPSHLLAAFEGEDPDDPLNQGRGS